MQIKYDLIYILEPMATPEDVLTVATKVEQITADSKGSVNKKEEWGKRRLAYSVRKHREGLYMFFNLSVLPAAIDEITRNLRMIEKVIKYIVVKETIIRRIVKVRVKKSKPAGSEGAGHSGYSRTSGRPGMGRPPYPPKPPAHSSAPAAAPAVPSVAPAVPATPASTAPVADSTPKS